MSLLVSPIQPELNEMLSLLDVNDPHAYNNAFIDWSDEYPIHVEKEHDLRDYNTERVQAIKFLIDYRHRVKRKRKDGKDYFQSI